MIKIKKNSILLLCIFVLYSFLSISTKAEAKESWRSFNKAGKFITAIAWDKSGNFWVAAEEFGVSLINRQEIKRFDIPYCYTIKCDDKGRVWLGSLRQGLYCYEYGEMKNFNTSNGLPTNTVYAIAFDRYDTPYCATGLGIAKFSGGKWETLNLPSHFPQSEISGMDFDIYGNLWVGFYLGGVAKFNGSDWRLYDSEDGLGGYERINDLLIAQDGTIWVTTCYGFNKLQSGANRWEYILLPRTYYPANYFLKITEDNSGNVFFANRHEAIIKWGNNATSWSKVVSEKQLPSSFVYCIAVDEDGYIWAGTYGGGITTNNPLFKFPKRMRKAKTPVEEASLKNFSEKPEQKKLISKVYNMLKNASEGENAYYIGEDWLTRGDWMDNYGKYAWILCAFYHSEGKSLLGGPNRTGFETFKDVEWDAYIGENKYPGDRLRGWLQKNLADTDNHKVLQNPLAGGKRHTEWDDHAEAYPHPLIRQGPHIYLDIDIPTGMFLVSFYFMNKDSHEGWNKYRDYTIEVKGRASSEKEFTEQRALLASCRVHDFTAGVYKRFMLKGPGKYTIKFDKEESFNTILSGVFIDKLSETE